MLLPSAAGGDSLAANQSFSIVFDHFSKKRRQKENFHQRAVFTMVMLKNTTLGREFYKTRSKQRPCNSAEAAAPPPPPNTPEVTTKNAFLDSL